MNPINHGAVLNEARRQLILVSVAISLTAVVLLLNRLGGPVSAALGLTAVGFSARLLFIASRRSAFTAHGPDGGSARGQGCHCAQAEHSWNDTRRDHLAHSADEERRNGGSRNEHDTKSGQGHRNHNDEGKHRSGGEHPDRPNRISEAQDNRRNHRPDQGF
jgi:hypothetical protein